MAKNVSDFVVERLGEWGVKMIYGYSGDGINGVMGALKSAEDKMRFIQVAHEELASFMACAHSKFTGEVGVCMATSGPGAIHLLNGLYDAKLDHQSVVAIVGQQARTSLGGSYQQEVDLVSLFKDVANEYVQMVTEPSQVRHVIDRAFRIAKAERCVTCVILPNDLQELSYEEPKRIHGSVHSSVGYSKPMIVPQIEDLRKAADVLNAGKKVAMLVGAGALNATKEVMEVAELLGAGVAKALLGKAVLDDDLPYCTGSLGLLGSKPSWDMMTECDTLFMIGSGFPYSEYLPKDGKARGVQIDIDGRMLGIRYPMEVHLQGDSKETLKQLIPLLKRQEDRNWQNGIISEVERWWKIVEARAHNSANPINPQYVFWELSKRLPGNSIITSDSGTASSWFAKDLKVRPGMIATLSGTLASMCPAMPYTIAAKFAHPDRPAIGLIGDGAMQMLGINGLITVAKYWKTWSTPTFIMLVLNNQDLNQVTWEQRVMNGDGRFDGSQEIMDMAYADYAKLLGLDGIKVTDPKDVPAAWDAAFASSKPFVLDIHTDPAVPPLPPHIDFKQMKAFTTSMLKGDSDAWDMVKQTYKDMVEEYLPH